MEGKYPGLGEKYDELAEHYREPGQWSEEKERMYDAAIAGMEDGELDPLLKYIEAGYVIEWQLAWTIGRAITGDDCPFLLQLKGKNKSARKKSDTQARHLELLELGAEIRKRSQADDRLKLVDAVADVAAAHGVGVSKCWEGYKLVKVQMDSDHLAPDWPWLMQLLPEEWAQTSDGTVFKQSK